MTPDFRKPVPPPAAQPLGQFGQAVPGFGTMPIAAGTVMDASGRPLIGLANLPATQGNTQIRPTEAELDGLRKLGLDPSKPIPANLAAALAAVRDDLDNIPNMVPVSPDTPPLQVDEVDIGSLPEAHQQALAAAAQQMLAQNQRLANLPRIDNAGAGINEALRVAALAGDTGPEIVDDRPQRPAATPAPTPSTFADPWAVNAARSAAPDPKLAAADARNADLERQLSLALGQLADAKASRTGAGASLTRSQCQHCGWDLERPDQVEPTADDKRDYLQMLLGGPGARFRRAYGLFADHVQVTFRALTYAEKRLCFQQMAHDVRQGKIIGDGEYLNRLQEYRLCCTLDTVSYGGVGIIDVPPPGDVPWDPPQPGEPARTVLVELRDWVESTVLPSESIQRVVGQNFERFQRLVEKLEASAEHADFWKGIGTPR